jgi:hypothetical protein
MTARLQFRLLIAIALLASACNKEEAKSKEDTAPPTKLAETAQAPAAKAVAKKAPKPTPAAEGRSDMLDFDKLADAALAKGFKDMDANNALWTALFGLEQWHLMTFPDSKSMPPGLNIETHDGKKWIMAFTDTDRLHAYAKERKQLNSDGTMKGMSIPSQTSFDFFGGLKKQGVFGIRFNQGEHGWFAPIDGPRNIHAFLKKKGLL